MYDSFLIRFVIQWKTIENVCGSILIAFNFKEPNLSKEKSIFPEDLYLSRAFIFIREFKYRRWEIYFYELVQRETESSLLVLPFFI